MTYRSLRRGWLLVALAACALILFAGCRGTSGGKKTGVGGETTIQPSPAAVNTQAPATLVTREDILRKDPNVTNHAELEWGAMFELSGPLQGFGEPAADGLKMAVEEINAAGGFQVGDTIYTIRLREHDTRSDTSQALAVATELVKDDKVKFIFGPAAVGDVETTAITQHEKVIHLCPCPSREITSLTSVEEAQGDSHWAFQTLPPASRFLAPGARDTRRDYPQFTSFATICVDSVVGKQFCKYFSDAYSAAGFEHTGEVLYPINTTDFRAFLTTLQGENPDIILNFTDAGLDQFQLLRDSWQLDIGKFYIAVALPYDLFEGLVGEGIRSKIVSSGAAPRNTGVYTSEKARAFFEDVYKPYKGGTLPPGAFAALLDYDPAYMLVAAMQRAGTVEDTTRIAEALEEVHYAGVGEDDMYFDWQHLLITGTDSCKLYQGEMTCRHNPPPAP
jgi:branched-chain amino acid transport system substrate-binding protein